MPGCGDLPKIKKIEEKRRKKKRKKGGIYKRGGSCVYSEAQNARPFGLQAIFAMTVRDASQLN
jgi:hypothetical protein